MLYSDTTSIVIHGFNPWLKRALFSFVPTQKAYEVKAVRTSKFKQLSYWKRKLHYVKLINFIIYQSTKTYSFQAMDCHLGNFIVHIVIVFVDISHKYLLIVKK